MGSDSELRRCRIGATGDVDLTNSDRLCLDGQRLVAVNGSTYWADGAEYRTQQSSRVKVIGHGTGANAWFEVFLPDGRRARYGDTSTSRTAPLQSSVPYLWSIRLVEDAFGNQLTVSYYRNQAGGTIYPLSIDYAGARIEFFYNMRSDTESLVYSSTGFVQSAKRMVALARIAISIDGTDVREYRLRNAEAVGEDYLHLRDIQVCGYDSAGISKECLNPLSFTWSMNSGAPDEFLCAVTRVTDGLGAVTEMDYTLVSGASNPLTYPESPFGTLTAPSGTTPVTASRRVVDELRRSDGVGGFRRTTYRYKEVPFTSTENRGYIGFSERRVTRHDVPDYDSSGNMVLRDITSYYQYRLDYPFVGQVSRELNVLDNDISTPAAKLSYSEQAWAAQTLHGGAVIMPHMNRKADQTYEDGAVISATETEYDLCFRALSGSSCPGSGTILEHATQLVTTTRTGTGLTDPGFTPQYWGDVPDRAVTGEQASTVRTTELENAPSEWILGFASNVTTTLDAPGEAAVSRDTERTRLPGTRRVQSSVGFPQDPDLELTVLNFFDLNGNLDEVRLSGQDVPLRVESIGGYLDQRYPASVTNAANQTSDLGYDVRFGVVNEHTDPDNLVATSDRDPFGRVTSVEHPDGTTQSLVVEACGSVPCSQVSWGDAAIRETVSVDNFGVQTAPTTRIYRDILGRALLRETQAFDPADGWVRVETHYDAAGRRIKTSLPYFSSGGSPDFVEAFHDITGRLVRQQRPDGGATTTSYDGSPGELSVTVTETVKTPGEPDETRAKQSLFDARGLLVSTTDALGTADAVTTTYGYDGALNLTSVTVDGQQVATMEFDDAGRRTSIDEVNTGLTTFEYDALSRLRLQTDANLNVTEFDYDDLDRLVTRVDGLGSVDEATHTWSWDPANATGQLDSRSTSGFDEVLAYDSLGRLDSVSTNVNVAGFPGNGTFVIDIGYDSQGRHATTTWPSGVTITTDYTARGYASAVREGSTILEQTEAVDAYGQVKESSYGNGLTTTRGYDVLGRLTAIKTGQLAAPAGVQDLEYTWRSNSSLYKRFDFQGTSTTSDDVVETFEYDDLDRLTQAETLHSSGSRVLSYDYDRLGNITTKASSVAGEAPVSGYQYNGPHRLSSAVVQGDPTTFVYDDAGNITRYDAASGNDTVLEYDARGQVVSTTTPIPGSPATVAHQFRYGPDGSRFLQQVEFGDNSWWILYLGNGSYEEIRANGAVMRQVRVTETVQHKEVDDVGSSPVTDITYRHRDHLGSVDAVTDDTGLKKLKFDPFGGRRSADSSAALDWLMGEWTLNAPTQRGFTDHEHLLFSPFIHTNGRVYDPRIGRFVQPDPIVQAPTFSQSYNRYAYVMNDPLSRLDPSGHCSISQSLESSGFQLVACTLGDLRLLAAALGGGPRGGGWMGGGGNPFNPPVSDAPPADPAPEPTDPPEDQPPEDDPPGDDPPGNDPPDNPPGSDPPPPAIDIPTTAPTVPVPGPGPSQTAGQVDATVADGATSFLDSAGEVAWDILVTLDSGAYYVNKYVLGVELRDYSDLTAAAPLAAIALLPGGRAAGIVASNGTRITGLTRHGVNRVIGDGGKRAGTRPQAILDALKDPKRIVEGVDSQGRPFQVFHGTNARVVVNPQTGQIVSTNPLSGAGAL